MASFQLGQGVWTTAIRELRYQEKLEMKLRHLAFRLHCWIGVIVGLLLVLMGLTGSLLVFDHEIDRFLNPSLLQVTPQGKRVSLETVLAAVREAYPNEKLSAIKYESLPKARDNK